MLACGRRLGRTRIRRTLREQQTYKKQAKKQHRIIKALAQAKDEEPEETDSETG